MEITLKDLSTSFKDGVYTKLLDEGIDPSTAYDVAFVSTSDIFSNDEYAEVLDAEQEEYFTA